ncbi:hypothetical protein C3941_02555 [Kaistia algarum]|uniref:DUF1295 domain-containing protein n=1 Tax=Kaistia algarum TaxID=2083279 RepID=UPI000CE761CE|nr:DUF1295 domain-containing protein [Kaistia algarum]MCX5512904.1 DUF1295 domain-containing protein [Kaistia algarum]PPE81608.1 hypothetical protein C3941_02555 [Kaistia algarum]
MTWPIVAIAVAAIFLVLVMTAAWMTGRTTGNAGWSDAFWSFGVGAAGVGVALLPDGTPGGPTARQLVIAVLIALWGLRLGLHIAGRSRGGPEDARYAELRREWGANFSRRLFVFLMIQAAAGTFLVVTFHIAAHNPAPGLRPQDYAAILLLAIAVIGETIADRQLHAFRRAGHRGKVCDVGLWSWSRHPNYFFEWLGWCAYPLFAIDLSGSYPWGWIALTGPAFMYWLLVHVSGIPLLEAHMLRSRPEAFRTYQRRVSAFFPYPPQSGG